MNGIHNPDLDAAARIRVGLAYSNSSRRNLLEFFTLAERAAIRTDSWTGIDLSAFATKLENAFSTCAGSVAVEIPGPAYFKLNRPIRLDGGNNIVGLGQGVGNYGVIFYPDLSIDWTSTYPNRGVIETSNFTYPTARVDGVAWDAAGPGYNLQCRLENIEVRCQRDSLWSANKSRTPHYGIVVHAPNEGWTAHRCNVYYAQKAGWLTSGLLSTPDLFNCGSFFCGDGTDTILGEAVTRSTGGAFGAAVYLFTTPTTAGTKVYLEAAAATDLDAIIAGNVLDIDGVSYTVSAVGSAASTITQFTRISGSASNTRRIRNVTFSSSVPAGTRGRAFPCGVLMGRHPDIDFAPGVAASDGGQGNSGLLRLYGFSGDRNAGALIGMSGSGTIEASAPKSEYNSSLVLIEGNGSGGAKPKVHLAGYRCSTDSSQPDQGVVCVVGTCRPSVVALGGQADVANAMFVRDTSDAGTVGVTNVAGGHGPIYWCPDSTEPAYFYTLQAAGMSVKDTNATLTLTSTSNASYTWRLRQVSGTTDTYGLHIGTSNDKAFSWDSTSTGTGSRPIACKFSVYNTTAAAAQEVMRIGQSGSSPAIGFLGAAPVVCQTLGAAATDAATTQTLANNLRTALINLGLGQT